MKKIGGIFIFASFFMATFVSSFFYAFGYSGNITHPIFSDNVSKIYNQNADRKLTQAEIDWLKIGSIKEDSGYWRCLNHFYNPQTGWGLYLNHSAKEWAQSKDPAQAYAWQDAIKAYAKGDNEKAFIALGHVLHLLEDMGVPAHTRNDQHIDGDPYEGWVKDNIQSFDYDVLPVYLNSLNSFFDDLAFYSHNNFLSKDTFLFNKDLPVNLLNNSDGSKRYYIIEEDNFGNKFRYVWVDFSIWGSKSYHLDDFTHADYLSLLGPRVVAYGAGLVDLFIKEAEAAKKEKAEQKKWWQKFNPLATLFSTQKSDQKEPEQHSLPISSNQEEFSANPKNNSVQKHNTETSNQVIEQKNPSQNFKQPKNDNIPVTEPIADDVLQKELKIPKKEKKEPNEGKIPEEEDKNPKQENKKTEKPETGSQGAGEPEYTSDQFGIGGIGPKQASDTIPDTTIQFGPASLTKETSATFVFSASKQNCAFKCVLDSQPEEDCESSKTYQSLAEGQHDFSVYAINQIGEEDESPASYSWTVDLSGPQVNNIQTLDISTNTASITFNTDEPAKTILNWGTDLTYGNIASQTQDFLTEHSFKLDNLSVETTYHFQIEAEDRLGNIASSSDNEFVTSSANADHLVISELQVAGQTSNDEWVEIYNPTDQTVNISSYSIQYRGSESQNYSKKNFTSGAEIPAKSFYLIANSGGYGGAVTADMSHSSFSLSGSGGNIFLVNDQQLLDASSTFNNVIDRVSYGSGNFLYPETSEFATAPSANKSLERKASQSSTANSLFDGTDKYQGNSFDTDNNSQDFVLQENPTPQNSQSLKEPRQSTDLTFSSKVEIAESSGSPTNSVNYPKILPISDSYQEVIWQKYTAINFNLRNKTVQNGVLDVADSLVSTGDTENKLLQRDSKLLKNGNDFYSLFLAQPAGQQKTLFVSQKENDVWGTPASMTFINPSYNAGWDMAIDSGGFVHIAWEDNDGSGLFYQKCDISLTGCDAALNLGELNVISIKVVLDSSNLPHVFYWRVNQKDIRERSFNGSTWDDNLVVQTNLLANNYTIFDIYSDNSGEFYLAWIEERSDGLWNYYHNKKTGGSWAGAEKIEEGVPQREDVDIVFNGSNVFVLSVNRGDFYKELNLWQRDGSSWLASVKVADSGQNGDYLFADLQVADSGKMFIVWKYTDNIVTSRVYYVESI